MSNLAPEAISPIPGLDAVSFKNYLMRALSGDTRVPASIIALINASGAEALRNAEERDEAWWQDLVLRLATESSLVEINRTIERYEQLADWHHEQAELSRGRSREAADRLAELDRFSTGAEEVLMKKERTGVFDRDAAIKLLQSRRVQVDPNADNATVTRLLVREMERAREDQKFWTRCFEDEGVATTRHERLEQENREKARELKEKRDAIRSAGLDPTEEVRQLRALGDRYRMDIQMKEAELEAASPNGEPDSSLDHLAQQALEHAVKDESTEFLKASTAMMATFQKAATHSPRAETETEISPAKKLMIPGLSPP